MAIYAHEKVRGVLEGEYGSVFKGRSMDFDDLREYIPGDDVKDIDWKRPLVAVRLLYAAILQFVSTISCWLLTMV